MSNVLNQGQNFQVIVQKFGLRDTNKFAVKNNFLPYETKGKEYFIPETLVIKFLMSIGH